MCSSLIGWPVTPTEASSPPARSRSLINEVLGAQLVIAALVGVIALAGLAWTSGSVIRNNLEHWATQWAAELNELGAPFYLSDSTDAVLDVERFIAKYPEIERVSWYDPEGRTLQSLRDAGPTDTVPEALTAQTVADLTALAGAPRPYLLDAGHLPTRGATGCSARSGRNRCAGDGLFDLDLKAAKTSAHVLGFVSVDLDFSTLPERVPAAAGARERACCCCCWRPRGPMGAGS